MKFHELFKKLLVRDKIWMDRCVWISYVSLYTEFVYKLTLWQNLLFINLFHWILAFLAISSISEMLQNSVL
jgi:hypothetical protein